MIHGRRWYVGTALISGLAVLVGILFLSHTIISPTYAAQTLEAEHAATQLKTAQDLSAAFEAVAAEIKPSVVNISSVKRIKPSMMQPDGQMPMSPDSPMYQFFGKDFFRHFFEQQMPPEGYEQRGLGTGVIVSDDGYILTNNHVVDGADEVTVTLSNKQQFKAKIVGTDPKSDLAVLKIDASGLYPATLGNSDKVKIGEWVVAAGQPFGLTYTITTGIVSATGRANVGVADYEDFIQTDAAINPGNSGGPLVDLKGHVIGINTAIFSRSGGYMGIGFAIPSNMAKVVMKSLIEHGKVVRGFLGVAIQNLNEGLAKSFGFKGTNGVLVGDVTASGPADKAGMKQGDIITEFNGHPVTDVQELRSAVAATAPGTEAKVEVYRDGETHKLTVKVGELEAGLAKAEGQTTDTAHDLGFTVSDLTPDLAEQLGVDNTKGVVVTAVEPLGLAANAGIQVKDLILSVQGEPVHNVRQFNRAISKHDLKNGIRLTVKSGSMERFVFLESMK